jgi:hypothetical protein
MHRDSPQGLRRMNNYNRVQGFINYTLSNLRNINGEGIRCPCKRCKNKKFLDRDVVTMHLLQKGFIEKYMCWYAHEEPYVPHDTMVEKMVGSNSSSSNVHGVVDDNSNHHRTIIMYTIRMNQGHVGQYLIVDEESNTNTTMFFNLLKILTNHYGMVAQIIVSYLLLHRCSTPSQIIVWVRPIMIELLNGQEAFYLKGIGWKRTFMLLSLWWNSSIYDTIKLICV